MSAASSVPVLDTPLLQGESLSLGYQGRAILPAFDVSIRRGRMLAVLGRNGSGKTTLLKTLLGFLPPVSGRVIKTTPAPHLAFMAQAATVDPLIPLRAREVVKMGTLSGWNFFTGRRQAEAAANAALTSAEAVSFANRFVRDLSEGQRQRVLLARVLAAHADAVFLDEPTAAMDAVAEQRSLALLRQWSRERGVAVVIITHLLGLARRYADEVLYLDRDDGVAICDRPGIVFSHPTFRRQFGEID
jgi:ABC-type Mn2+/Zn2+ transport system ATPase subunit